MSEQGIAERGADLSRNLKEWLAYLGEGEFRGRWLLVGGSGIGGLSMVSLPRRQATKA